MFVILAATHHREEGRLKEEGRTKEEGRNEEDGRTKEGGPNETAAAAAATSRQQAQEGRNHTGIN